MPDVPDSPRVDELFSRAVVAQLAEQRAQRETFAQVERRLDALERLVLERLSDLSKLIRGGETDLRLELMEEELSTRFLRLETLVREELQSRFDGLAQSVSERLAQLEETLRSGDVAPQIDALERSIAGRVEELETSFGRGEAAARLAALEQQLAERIGHLEETFRFDEVGPRLAALEAVVDERFSRWEEAGSPVLQRLETLETTLGQRIGHLEESVRSEELGQRLKALELAIEERSGPRTSDVEADTTMVEARLEALQAAVDDRLAELRAALEAVEQDKRVEALDQSVGYRLTRLEGSMRRLEEHTSTRLEDLRAASTAAEAGILERISAESQVVGAHFKAVRPVVEAAAQAGSDLETALDELRRLATTARAAAAMAADPGSGQGEPGDGTPYSVASLDPPTDDDAEDTIFLPPEETPIPDRRFGGLLPRRDR